MKPSDQQLRVDILFVMSTRSSKYWRGKELCPYLSQLNVYQLTPKMIKKVLTDMVDNKILERVRVKPQWSLYAYKSTNRFTHDDIPSDSGGVVRRSQADNVW